MKCSRELLEGARELKGAKKSKRGRSLRKAFNKKSVTFFTLGVRTGLRYTFFSKTWSEMA